nr:hypothetical protein HUO10_003267 [Paraburkholderia busanensis]
MTKKYDVLDALILASIGTQPKTFAFINTGDVAKECERLAAAEDNPRADSFRICDRRLQALRKAEKIRSTSKGWVLR